ncbi:sugar transferase [Nocardioides sp. Soil805]|uniref:sugar transferase n=1 Tax=Nocardioides sp. Soil805 TaxID=1736416 RepID=UPI0007025BCC|nr:sugar transferase [Nocardioides sp. Soil805]KRF35046.1 hypothetical protein ASG94_13010 [Nocardioides sp. Soil805]
MSHVSHLGEIAPARSFQPVARLRLAERRSADSLAVDGWRDSYARVLLLVDTAVLVVAVAGAQLVRFGPTGAPESRVQGIAVSYPVVGIALAVGWWISLQVHQARNPHVVGHGAEEYRRIVVATFRAFAVLAMLSVAFKVDSSRLYLAIAFPLGLGGLLLGRKIARVHLRRRRLKGDAMVNVMVVGGSGSASQLAGWFAKHAAAGFRVSGVWVPDAHEARVNELKLGSSRVPVMSTRLAFEEALAISRATTVVVTDTEHLGHEALRELTWRLEGTGIDLMLSPNVLDVSSSRLRLHDVSGMPMLHLTEPQYAGAARLGKTAFDRIGALVLLLALAPVLLAVALAVKLTSSGSVFYRQSRVGRDGESFAMVKFRSMRVGADAELAALLAAEGKSLAALPKLTQDPRVTRVGAFIRRFSLDELPQLFNVVRGDMSLVGPRPQRDFEVEQYDHVATRRLTVRPGMTGLWQVSGRSDISFEDAISLDVHYVENWSMTADLMILWKTVRAVVASDGAY